MANLLFASWNLIDRNKLFASMIVLQLSHQQIF